MNTRHAVERLRTRLDLADAGSWPDDCLTAFLGYEHNPHVDRLLREAVFRGRLDLLANLLPAHLAAADPTVRRDCLALLDLLADAPGWLLEGVLARPSLEPWLRTTPDTTSAAGLGGLLAAVQCGRPGPAIPWSALVAPLHLGRLVVNGAQGRVVIGEDGATRVTTAGGTVEFDPSLLSRETPQPMISGTTLSFVLAETEHSRFVLDGFDTRLAHSAWPTERLAAGQPRTRRWTELVDSASRLLTFLDPLAAEQVDRTMRILIPHHRLDGRRHGLPQRELVSSTTAATAGAFGMSLGDESASRIAEALVHEHARTRLRTLLRERPMHGPDTRHYPAPWCRDPRTISGLVLDIAAYTLVSAFHHAAWTAMAANRLTTDRFGTATPDEDELALTVVRRRAEVRHAIRRALDADELLPFGRLFLSAALERVSEPRVKSS